MSTTGEMIGPYFLGKRLGQGGFGAVYEATHQETGQRVAIKFLHGSQELDPEVQNRFVREVTLLKRFDDENVVRLFDSGLHEGKIYCAMELVECGTLKDVLTKRREIPWREAAEVALQVCRGLGHAHARGCVHRDLKPANLYLAEDGLVKVGDLGLARDLQSSRLTTSGQTVGTWRYMPPEQITAQDDIDGRLDLYALGCILFEMIAGRVPFDGPDFAAIFDQHLESPPPRLDRAADCPKPLADLVDWMLAKRPEDRPETAEVVAAQLEAILSGAEPLNPMPTVQFQSVGLLNIDQLQGKNLTSRLHEPGVRPQRKMSGKNLGVVAAVIVLVILVVLALNSGG